MCLSCLGSRRGPGWTNCRVFPGHHVPSSRALPALGVSGALGLDPPGSSGQSLLGPSVSKLFPSRAPSSTVIPSSCSRTHRGSMLPVGQSPQPEPPGTGPSYHPSSFHALIWSLWVSCLPAHPLHWAPSASRGSLASQSDAPFPPPFPGSAPNPGLRGGRLRAPCQSASPVPDPEGTMAAPWGRGRMWVRPPRSRAHRLGAWPGAASRPTLTSGLRLALPSSSFFSSG